jgi:hypothetical protein
MPGKLVVARPNYNALTAEPKNLAFSSEFELNKIARIMRFTAAGSANHGLPYAPKFFAMREITSSPLKMGWGGVGRVDNTKVWTDIFTHSTNFSYDNWQVANDSASWIILFADNLSEGVYKKDIHGGVVLVGKGDSDYKYKIHSQYDTFKVYKTGRLTVNAGQYDNGAGGGYRITSTTFNHNLGYVPIFGPFVDYEINKDEYIGWNGQYLYQNDSWAVGVTYHIGIFVYEEDSSKWWKCKQTHTSSSSNKPESGANWQDYWDYEIDPSDLWVSGKNYYVGDFVANQYSDWYRCIKTHTSGEGSEPGVGVSWETFWESSYNYHDYNTYLNKLEDIKLVYGGLGLMNSSTFLYYATETQLVLSLVQTQAPDQYPYYEHTPCPAETVYVDYTIFYNKANEELDLLSS